MLFEFLIAGGWVFWAVLAIIGAALVVLINDDKPGSATVAVIASAVFFTLFTDFNVFAWTFHNSGLVALLAVAYVLVGIAYVRVKWGFWTRSIGRKAQKVTDTLSRRPGETDEQFIDRARYDAYRATNVMMPIRVDQHKGRVMGWLVYWPFSAAWTLLRDPITTFYNAIYDWLGTTLQRVADRNVNDVIFKK